MKPALRVVLAAPVQLSLSMDGVLRDVQHAFYGLCVNAGKQVLAAMMEADRVALCGAKGVPDASRRATRGGHTDGAVVLGGQCLERRQHALQEATWASPHEDLDGGTGCADCTDQIRRTEGRVTSQQRNRHTAWFNNGRDNARIGDRYVSSESV